MLSLSVIIPAVLAVYKRCCCCYFAVRPTIQLIPKTPSEKKKRLKIWRRHGAAFGYRRFSNNRTSNFRYGKCQSKFGKCQLKYQKCHSKCGKCHFSYEKYHFRHGKSQSMLKEFLHIYGKCHSSIKEFHCRYGKCQSRQGKCRYGKCQLGKRNATPIQYSLLLTPVNYLNMHLFRSLRCSCVQRS